MLLVKEKITIDELKTMSQKMFGELVKAVVDIEKGIMVVDAPLHADEEFFLLENGSKQEDLWGINIFPDQFGSNGFIVFDSMINLRPSAGNKSRSVESLEIQKRIKKIVDVLVVR